MRRFALAFALAACAPRAPARFPGELASMERVAGDFLARQRVETRWRGRDVAFDAVLQKKGATLTLVGMTPFGTRAFTLVQTGTEVRFESHLDRDLGLDPRNILLDVHRAFFLGLPDSPRADGEHAAEIAGEEIHERWQGARLEERRFRRLDGKPKGTITVTYEGGMANGIPPSKVTLDNGWYGYRLTVTTLSYSPL